MQCNLFKIPNTMHRKVTHLPNTFTVKKPVSAPKRKKGTYFAVNSFQGVKINIAQSTEKFRCKMKLFGFSFLCSSNPSSRWFHRISLVFTLKYWVSSQGSPGFHTSEPWEAQNLVSRVSPFHKLNATALMGSLRWNSPNNWNIIVAI